MNRYIQEVIDAHVIIENWLGRGEGSASALMQRFSADFVMIPPSGARMDNQAVSAFFQGASACRPGLKIVIDNVSLLAEWHDGAVVMYKEIQYLPGKPESARWSTAVFRLQQDKIVWLHLHETAQG
ncbi:nuclear transport factor 2 family protein [Kluyvera sp. STS39-E]|uniref:nuclear transport factor 2 family protein n=1 Tax=Kluyvera sp. STS39-E TaxID=3234748 RepID=UPI0034C6C0FE